MYFRATAFESNTLADHAMPYRCVHCDYQTTARAYAFGRGTGISPYGVDDNGAAARADRHARSSATAQAALSIRIAPCPRCHRTDRRAILGVYRNTLLACIALLVLPVVLVAWSGQRWQAAAFVGALIGFAPAMLLWKHKTSQLTSKSVRFDPAP